MEVRRFLQRIFKWAVSAALAILLCIYLLYGYLQRQEDVYRQTYVPFLNSTIPSISTWDPKRVASLFVEKARPNVLSPESVAALALYSHLGKLKDFEAPVFERVETGMDPVLGTYKVVVYSTKAIFENGSAVLTMNVTEKGGNMYLTFLNIAPTYFAAPAANGS
ncbi:MAG: hypothetical protein HY749_24140 [Gammaproteobacteria bacterium]|nr:hypothetical protein [Gammaproteobacteria bacterium]